ncbi:MAG: 50S ribosomal protein L24 [Candidatus Omnitrophica bacterium]|nr:50S ribosomal protein L24 [Candidatus Omnitrophota bacterium]
MLKIKKNDDIIVNSGKDRGKRGKVVRLVPTEGRAIVQGVNIIKRHVRPNRDNPRGGIMQMEGTIHISNLKLVCPRCSKPTRVGITVLADGTRKRMCKKCKEIIE